MTNELQPKFDTANIVELKPFAVQLAELKQHNETLTFDYHSPTGNKDARSHIFTLRQSKSALEKARKGAKQKSLDYGKAVDMQAKVISADLEAMISTHHEPIMAIEQAEKDRVVAHKNRLEAMQKWQTVAPDTSIGEWKHMLKEVDAVDVDSFDEFNRDAIFVKQLALKNIQAALTKAETLAEEKAELIRLRTQQAETERLEKERTMREAMKADAEHQAQKALQNERLKIEYAEKERQETIARLEREKTLAEDRAHLAEKNALIEAERNQAAKIQQAGIEAARQKTDKVNAKRNLIDEKVVIAVTDIMERGGTADELERSIYGGKYADFSLF